MYCVYVHRFSTSREIFYVGLGRPERSKSKSERNKIWKSIVEKDPVFIVEIVEDKLSRDTAFELEEFLINEISPIANIKSGSMSRVQLDFRELSEKFYVDETSRTGLRYKVDSKRGAVFKEANEEAGSKNKAGYWSINCLHGVIPVHRVVWCLTYPDSDYANATLVIDHIDGDRSNNSIKNLRLVSYQKNNNNRKTPNTNKTGTMGIMFDNHRTNPRYRVDKVINGVRINKSFSINKHGKDEALRLAETYLLQHIPLG